LQQFGGSAGGAIKKDKVFWFGAIELQKSKTPGIVRYTTIDSVAVTPDNKEAYDYYRSLEGGFARSNDATALTARGDYQMGGGGRVSFRYNFSDATAVNAASTGGAADVLTTFATSANGNEKDRTHSAVAQWTSFFGPSLANDLRFSYTKEIRPRSSNS